MFISNIHLKYVFECHDCQNTPLAQDERAQSLPSPGNARGDLPDVRRRHHPCAPRWGGGCRPCARRLERPCRNTLLGRYAVPADLAPPAPAQRQLRCTRMAPRARHHPDIDIAHRRPWQSGRRSAARLHHGKQPGLLPELRHREAPRTQGRLIPTLDCPAFPRHTLATSSARKRSTEKTRSASSMWLTSRSFWTTASSSESAASPQATISSCHPTTTCSYRTASTAIRRASSSMRLA